MTEATRAREAPSQDAAPRTWSPGGWLNKRSMGVGAGSGLLAGVCCIGSALAVGAGVGGLSFFSAWRDRYQVYFIAASVVLMVLWFARLARRHGFSRGGVRRTGRVLLRHGLVMAGMYGFTIGLAFAVMRVAEAV